MRISKVLSNAIASIFFLAVAPAAIGQPEPATIRLSDEIPVSEVRYSLRSGFDTPRVTSRGDDFLVVWRGPNLLFDVYYGTVLDQQGQRNPTARSLGSGLGPATPIEGGAGLFVFLSRDGSLSAIRLDEAGATSGSRIELHPRTLPTLLPRCCPGEASVVWTGRKFVVVWAQPSYVNEPGGIGPVPRTKMSVALLDQDSNRLQNDLTLSEGAASGDVAFGAGLSMAVFQKPDGLYIRTIDEAGSLGEMTKVLELSSSVVVPSITWAGDGFLITYRQANTLFGLTVDLSGKRRSDLFPITTSVFAGADVGWIGGAILAVWTQPENNGDIYGRRLLSDGTFLDPQPFAIATGPESQRNPAMGFNGRDSLVAWAGGQGVISTALLTKEGSITPAAESGGSRISYLAQDQTSPSMTYDGRQIAIGWREEPGARFSFVTPAIAERHETALPFVASRLSSNGQQSIAVGSVFANSRFSILASRIDQAGTVLDLVPLTIASSSRSLTLSGVLWNGSEYLVSWIESGSNGGELKAGRITSDGQVLDPNGWLIAQSNALKLIVRWNGSHYLATWNRSNAEILSVRFNRSGVSLDPAPLVVAPLDFHGYPDFDAIADGDGYFVAWLSQPIFDQATQLWGVTLRSNGTLEERKLLVSDGERKRSLHVAENGLGHELLWLENPLNDSSTSSPTSVHSIRVSHQGQVSDHRSIALPSPTTTFEALSLPNRGFIALAYERVVGDTIHGEASRVFIRHLLPSRRRGARRSDVVPPGAAAAATD